MMYLVKRALSKAFNGQMPQTPRGHQRQSQQPSKNTYAHTSANQNHHDVVETMWVGMSTEQLRRSFGWPLQKETSVEGEVWIYANLNGQGTQTSITIQNAAVTGWQDFRAEQPQTAS